MQGYDPAVVRGAGRHEAVAPAIPDEVRFRLRFHLMEQCEALWQVDVRHVHPEGGLLLPVRGGEEDDNIKHLSLFAAGFRKDERYPV